MDQRSIDYIATGDPMDLLGGMAGRLYAAVRHELRILPTLSPKRLHGAVIARLMLDAPGAELFTEDQWEILDAASKIIAERISTARTARQACSATYPAPPAVPSRKNLDTALVRWAQRRGWTAGNYDWVTLFERPFFEYAGYKNMLICRLQHTEGQYLYTFGVIVRSGRIEYCRFKMRNNRDIWAVVDTTLIEVY